MPFITNGHHHLRSCITIGNTRIGSTTRIGIVSISLPHSRRRLGIRRFHCPEHGENIFTARGFASLAMSRGNRNGNGNEGWRGSDLEKRYMSSSNTPAATDQSELESELKTEKKKKEIAVPRPSASVLLISPKNEVLLLHRVESSSSFPSAHVFPGGNLSESDGEIPEEDSVERHRDGMTYRIAAIRECFEECGILLARPKGYWLGGDLLELSDEKRETGRKLVHSGAVGIKKWVEERGGVLDVVNLHPFTRWITPSNLPKRYTTQMYIYFLSVEPPSTHFTTSAPNEPSTSHIPTHDGGLEHTAATWASCEIWLNKARCGEIVLFPPQFYLLSLMGEFLKGVSSECKFEWYGEFEELETQRDLLRDFLKTDGGDGTGVKWGEKVISPVAEGVTSEGKSVMGLGKQGPELVREEEKETGWINAGRGYEVKIDRDGRIEFRAGRGPEAAKKREQLKLDGEMGWDSVAMRNEEIEADEDEEEEEEEDERPKGYQKRKGDGKRVILVRFGKEGPKDLEVRERKEVLAEMKKSAAAAEKKAIKDLEKNKKKELAAEKKAIMDEEKKKKKEAAAAEKKAAAEERKNKKAAKL